MVSTDLFLCHDDLRRNREAREMAALTRQTARESAFVMRFVDLMEKFGRSDAAQQALLEPELDVLLAETKRAHRKMQASGGYDANEQRKDLISKH